MMDADTTGIEPDFALIKYKKLIDGSTMQIVNQSVHPALQHLKYSAAEIETITNHILNTGYVSGCSTLKPEHHNIFACALGPNVIHYKDHMLMMAAVQPFISGAISKTINLPADVTVEEIEDIYVYGWRLGLKNLALYRDGCKAEQVLHTSLEDKDKKTPTIQAPPAARRLKLPQQRRGTTTSFRIDGCEGYVRTGEFPDGSLGEIFVDVSKQGSTLSGLMDVFAISVSLGLQHGVPLEVYVEKFTSQKFAPAGITKDPDFRMVKSLPDYIFRRLAADYLADDVRHGLNIKTTKERTAEVDTETVKETISKTYTHVDAPLCTTCGVAMRTAGSCFCCEECGVTSGCS
jgi:ribonucleoside-diphosphate reductase alpha chain